MTAADQIAFAALVPVAHVGHWLWVFYVLPVIIVIIGILWSTRTANRRERDEEEQQQDRR